MAESPNYFSPDEYTPIKKPRGGIPKVLKTPGHYRRAAEILAAGVGPFAIDTERAATYRYDDRAFLIQIKRRGAGTFIFAPENHRAELSRTLGRLINDEDWVMHAATTDLPALAMLRLYPRRLFDTQVASRLLGMPKVNLAAVVGALLGYKLEKTHGNENWSTTPLPTSWVSYAALDVEFLLDAADKLAELLDNQDKLEWAEEEFAWIVSGHRIDQEVPQRNWRQLKGLNSLRTRQELAIAKELWNAREKIAAETDTAPSRLLPDRLLLSAAHSKPRTPYEFFQAGEVRKRHSRNMKSWLAAINRGLMLPRPLYPQLNEPIGESQIPKARNWKIYHPESYQLLTELRETLIAHASTLEIQPDSLLEPRVLHAAIWRATAEKGFIDATDLADFLSMHGARPWQISVNMPILAPLLL
ncbi:HRDC domain-containing protein [Corynebacterium caspium]|uniref:HRDC domain-containing protein n=1 Tax=Corynebacterium caspium TaxID=234828 RepID=UPI00035FDDC4|nr:HRDC domain-containing protein [Corynebacterium caspium]WKD59159.1 Ribonuclease D [Corynebacterium caspium DSM 44850]